MNLAKDTNWLHKDTYKSKVPKTYTADITNKGIKSYWIATKAKRGFHKQQQLRTQSDTGFWGLKPVCNQ